MRVSRKLSDDLVVQLTRARQLELAAETLAQTRNTVSATSTLMLAAVDAGWLVVDIAQALGIRPGTASRRVREARRRRGDAAAGLVVDQPPEIRGPLAELDTPVEDHEWLTRAEAADYLGVAGRTVQDLFTDGLLPNSRRLTGTWRVYLRARPRSRAQRSTPRRVPRPRSTSRTDQWLERGHPAHALVVAPMRVCRFPDRGQSKCTYRLAHARTCLACCILSEDRHSGGAMRNIIMSAVALSACLAVCACSGGSSGQSTAGSTAPAATETVAAEPPITNAAKACALFTRAGASFIITAGASESDPMQQVRVGSMELAKVIGGGAIYGLLADSLADLLLVRQGDAEGPAGPVNQCRLQNNPVPSMDVIEKLASDPRTGPDLAAKLRSIQVA